MNDRPDSTGRRFERLVETMARLRAPDGCPWDRKQTFDTIKPYLVEETYEVLDAIDARDWRGLSDELGDLVLQVVFFAQMAADEGYFTIDDSLAAIQDKLIRRHPHVGGEGKAETPEDVKTIWEQVKADEKRAADQPAGGLLDGVSRQAPALVEARAISGKAAAAGFDWEGPQQVLEKLHEELAEIEAARDGGNAREVESEIGDLLFVVVNLARFLKVDPEQALRGTNARFRRRFGHIETRLGERGLTLSQVGIAEMEELWQEAKRMEKSEAQAG